MYEAGWIDCWSHESLGWTGKVSVGLDDQIRSCSGIGAEASCLDPRGTWTVRVLGLDIEHSF